MHAWGEHTSGRAGLPHSGILRSKLLINKLHRDGRYHLLHEASHAQNTLVLVTLLYSAYRLPRGELLLPAGLQTEILTEQKQPDNDVFCHDGDSPQ